MIPALADAELKAQMEQYLVLAIRWGLYLGFGKAVPNNAAETLQYMPVPMLRENEGWIDSFSIRTDRPFDRGFIQFEIMTLERLAL